MTTFAVKTRSLNSGYLAWSSADPQRAIEMCLGHIERIGFDKKLFGTNDVLFEFTVNGLVVATSHDLISWSIISEEDFIKNIA